MKLALLVGLIAAAIAKEESLEDNLALEAEEPESTEKELAQSDSADDDGEDDVGDAALL